MINKILLSLIILLILFILTVFNAPSIAIKIEEIIWINWLSDRIKWFKDVADWVSTNVPTKTEFENAYDSAYSWAVDIRDNIINWANVTRWKIDDIRETVIWAEKKFNEVKDSYNQIKDSFDEAKEFIDTNSWNIKKINNAVQSISEIRDNLVNTWSVIATWSTNTWVIN